MSREEQTPFDPAEYDPSGGDPAAAPTLFWGVAGTILVIATVLLLQAFYSRSMASEIERKAAPGLLSELRDHQSQQNDLLNRHHWVDMDTNNISIPLSEAIKRLVKNPNYYGEAVEVQ